MKCAKMLLLIITGFLLLPVSFAQDTPAEERAAIPEWPKRVIEYEVVNEPLEKVEFEALPGQSWPSYAAVMTVGAKYWPGDFLGRKPSARQRHDALTEKLLQQEAAKHLSERQREYIQSSTWVFRESVRYDIPGQYGGDGARYTLYAVSEDDLTWMTEALLEFIDADSRGTFKARRAELVSLRENLPTQRKDLNAAEASQGKLAAQLEKSLAGTPYKSADDAIEDIDRLSLSLRSVEVDMAGIEAKIAAIQGLKDQKRDATQRDTALMLDRALIEQDIEMAGALARKHALKAHLTRAEGVRDLGRKVAEVELMIKGLREKCEADSKNIKRLERELDVDVSPARWQSTGPVAVIGKVQIQPVKAP